MKDVLRRTAFWLFAFGSLSLLIGSSGVGSTEKSGWNLDYVETCAVFGGDGMIGYACSDDTGCLAVNTCAGFGTGCEQGWEDVNVGGDFYMCADSPTTKCTATDVDDCITRIACEFEEDTCVIATPLVVVGSVQSFDDCATGL